MNKRAEGYFNCSFAAEVPVEIGQPPKPHKFDLVSDDKKVVIECKCYSWTEGGNVPSAKLATLDEANPIYLVVVYGVLTTGKL